MRLKVSDGQLNVGDAASGLRCNVLLGSVRKSCCSCWCSWCSWCGGGVSGRHGVRLGCGCVADPVRGRCAWDLVEDFDSAQRGTWV